VSLYFPVALLVNPSSLSPHSIAQTLSKARLIHLSEQSCRKGVCQNLRKNTFLSLVQQM